MSPITANLFLMELKEQKLRKKYKELGDLWGEYQKELEKLNNLPRPQAQWSADDNSADNINRITISNKIFLKQQKKVRQLKDEYEMLRKLVG